MDTELVECKANVEGLETVHSSCSVLIHLDSYFSDN